MEVKFLYDDGTSELSEKNINWNNYHVEIDGFSSKELAMLDLAIGNLRRGKTYSIDMEGIEQDMEELGIHV